MWSIVRSLSLASLISSACTVTAQLSFVASVKQHGKEVDASSLSFVRIPPLERRWHASRPRRGQNNRTVERDAVSYSANWCGASQHAADSDGIKSVLGYFTAPDLTLRPGTPAPQFAAAWVGIDGAACNTTLLQAGVTTIVNSDGGQSASAWWEWYPEASYTISGLKVKAGEWMSVNITTKDASSAILVIENADTGTSVTLELNNGPQLCRRDAEWILEDFYESGKQVALANFADLWFVDSGATTVGGKNVGFDGATMVHLRDENGNVLCSPEPYDNSNFVIVSKP
ncbi:protease [Thermothelomyces heterothallicus CBS 202.75]|uniref:protease n=1 Tax=Thermothelomyces heterothallicus CBS 202.75 TaxID=1149848 RepID=UPI0037428075